MISIQFRTKRLLSTQCKGQFSVSETHNNFFAYSLSFCLLLDLKIEKNEDNTIYQKKNLHNKYMFLTNFRFYYFLNSILVKPVLNGLLFIHTRTKTPSILSFFINIGLN
jgi:hypothetical protein